MARLVSLEARMRLAASSGAAGGAAWRAETGVVLVE